MVWKKFYEVEAGLYIKRVGEDNWELVEVIGYTVDSDEYEMRELDIIWEFMSKYEFLREGDGDFDDGCPFSDFNRGFYRTYYFRHSTEDIEETGIEEWMVEFVYEKRWVEEEE